MHPAIKAFRAWPMVAVALLLSGISIAGTRDRNSRQDRRYKNTTSINTNVAFSLLTSSPSLAEQCTGALSGVTATRSTSAYCTKADGSMVLLGANTPRVEAGGLLVESTATNLALRSQELDNATWSFDNGGAIPVIVTANAGVAPDGTTTAERFQYAAMSSGQWATKFQTVTLTAAAHVLSFYVKGVSTSGTLYPYIEKTAVFSSAATCSYTSTAWSRCTLSYTTPSSGSWTLRIGTDTRITGTPSTAAARDVYVWGVQVETGTDASSYIPTTTASQNRTTEVVYADITPVEAMSYSVLATVNRTSWPTGGSPKSVPLSLYKDASNRAILGFSGTAAQPSMLCHWHSGGVDYFGTSSIVFPYTYSTGYVPFACIYDGINVNDSVHGHTTNTARSFTVPAITRVYLGTWDITGAEWNGHIKDVCVGRTADACSSAKSGTSDDIAWVGDSLTSGDASAPTRPGIELNRLLQRPVYAIATGGNTASQCLTNFRNNVKGKSYGTLVVLCGVNSISGGATDAQTWTDLQTLFDEARADGLQLVPVLLTPWKNATGWNSTRQGYQDALNVTISNYCTTYGLTCVDTSSMGGQGGDPLILLTTYNSGDGQHFNAAGSTKLAQLVQAAAP